MSYRNPIMNVAELREALRLAQALPQQLGHERPLYEAALSGLVDLACPLRRDPAPRACNATGRNRALAVTLADVVEKPAGPGTWRSAAMLRDWAEIAVLHRAGSDPCHYGHTAELAKTHRRVLLVEAPEMTWPAWRDMLEARAALPIELLDKARSADGRSAPGPHPTSGLPSSI